MLLIQWNRDDQAFLDGFVKVASLNKIWSTKPHPLTCEPMFAYKTHLQMRTNLSEKSHHDVARQEDCVSIGAPDALTKLELVRSNSLCKAEVLSQL